MKNMIWLVLASMLVVVGCADDDAGTLPNNNNSAIEDVGLEGREPRGLGEPRTLGVTAFDGDANIQWILIEGDTDNPFMMGNDNSYKAEAPVHAVNMDYDFEIMKTEATVQHWHECEMAGWCFTPTVEIYYEDTDTTDTDSGPGTVVEDVYAKCPHENYNEAALAFWGEPHLPNQAMACLEYLEAYYFCMWAGGRVPTEAEWEYAARSEGQDYQNPWDWDNTDLVDSDSWADCDHAYMSASLLPELGHGGCAAGAPAVAPTTCGDPTDFGDTDPSNDYAGFPGTNTTEQGVCDMAGNVAEWTYDLYHPTYENAPTDGSSWTADDGHSVIPEARVIRGGHSSNFAGWVRTTSRSYNSAFALITGRSDGPMGIRCVKDIP